MLCEVWMLCETSVEKEVFLVEKESAEGLAVVPKLLNQLSSGLGHLLRRPTRAREALGVVVDGECLHLPEPELAAADGCEALIAPDARSRLWGGPPRPHGKVPLHERIDRSF